MIENTATAKGISELLLNITGRLSESVARVKDACPPSEATAYARCVGRLVNSIFEDILEPIYVKHLALKPIDLEMNGPAEGGPS